ncbi:MAG: thiol:disulfide interchange protein DsbD [Burkholderiales bacterium]
MPTRPRHLDRPLRRLAAAAALALAAATSAFAQPVRTPNVEAELVPATTAGVPGKPVTVALRLAMREGWHTYWRNPGDTGLPTTIEWKLPDSVTAGQIDWPAPHALPIGPLVNYGYEGEIFLPSALAIPENAKPGSTLAIAARVDWLVCKETCIPEGADLTLALPVATAAEAHPRWGAPIAATIAALPKPLAGWTVAAQGEGQRIKLTLAPPEGAADPGELRFFPNDEGRIEASSPQVATKEGAAHVLSLPVAYQLVPGFTRVAGVVTGTNGFAGAKAATIDVPLAGSVVAGPKPIDTAAAALPSAPAVSTMSLALAALFAFGGGLILNLMPCVLPVLSIKVLGFAQHHDSRATMRREGLAYGAGVLVTFIALALLLLALRAAGEELGWGFQLQSPIFVTLLAVLFFALGLNLSGVYEFGQFAPASVRGWTAKNRTLDAFSTGILAVVIASPCTAPFMGAALGFALGQPAVQTLAVFVALGLGMALPYVLFAWFPAWRRLLPKPGAWMVRFKQVLAFPLYATVAWLAWVLGVQLDVDAVLRLAFVLIAVAFALWALHAARMGGGRPWRWVAAVAAIGAIAMGAPLAAPGAAPSEASRATASAAGPWQPYSPASLATLRAAGPVFVDFTAAWCVTCQVNKRLVLNDRGVVDAFGAKQVTLVRADWTRRDPDITRALAALGRNGVPVYVLYRPGREPLLLPEVLTSRVVHDALATL